MTKLVFISGSPVSRIVGEKYNASYYVSKGFSVEYWDLSRIYYNERALGLYFGGHEEFRFKFPIEKQFHTKLEVEKALQQIERQTIICHTDFNVNDDYWLRRFYKKHNICYYTGPRRTSARFAYQKGNGLDLTTFLHKAISVIKVRARLSYFKQKFFRFLFKNTNFYQKPAFVVGSGTLGRKEFLNVSQARYFISVPSADLVWDPLPKIVEGRYCVYIDDSVVYSPDQSMLKDKQSTCNDMSIYSENICKVFELIEKSLDCKVVIAASGKYDYQDNDIFGDRKIIYMKTNQLIQYAEIVIGHSSSATWQVIADLKPIILLWDQSFIKAKNVAITLQAAFLGITPILATELTTSDLKNIKVNAESYHRLKEEYFCEEGIRGSIEEIIEQQLHRCI